MYQAKFYQLDLKSKAIIFVGWTLYGTFFAGQAYIQQALIGKNTDWWNIFFRWIICGYSWAFLTPLILVLAARFPFQRKKWLAAIGIHLPVAALLSLFQLALYLLVSQLILGVRSGSQFDRYQRLVVEEFHVGVLIYFAIVAIGFARTFLFRTHSNPRVFLTDIGENSGDDTMPLPGSIAIGNGANPDAISPAYVTRLSIKEAGRISFVDTNEIRWINSEGNYVKLHTNQKRYLMRETMNAMEQKLDPDSFVRIRRSTIVHVEQIVEVHRAFSGDFRVILKDGAKLRVSRRYRKNLDTILKFKVHSPS